MRCCSGRRATPTRGGGRATSAPPSPSGSTQTSKVLLLLRTSTRITGIHDSSSAPPNPILTCHPSLLRFLFFSVPWKILQFASTSSDLMLSPLLQVPIVPTKIVHVLDSLGISQHRALYCISCSMEFITNYCLSTNCYACSLKK